MVKLVMPYADPAQARQRVKERTARLKAAGLCQRCGKAPPKASRTMCEDCLRSERERDCRQRPRGSTNNRRPGYRKEYRDKKVKEALTNNMCPQCFARPNMSGRKRCETCTERGRKYSATARAKHGSRWQHLLKKYGLSRSQWTDLFAAQGNRCAICGRSEPGGKDAWHTDHDHEAGTVRGILCHDCNVGLGHFGDNVTILAKASKYLRKHGNAATAKAAQPAQLTLLKGG